MIVPDDEQLEQISGIIPSELALRNKCNIAPVPDQSTKISHQSPTGSTRNEQRMRSTKTRSVHASKGFAECSNNSTELVTPTSLHFSKCKVNTFLPVL